MLKSNPEIIKLAKIAVEKQRNNRQVKDEWLKEIAEKLSKYGDKEEDN